MTPDLLPPPPGGCPPPQEPLAERLLDKAILFCLRKKPVVAVVLAAAILAGLACAPFDWDLGPLPRSPVPVDAIPDVGENQQIVYAEWEGRSPRDVEDQVTYPLTTALLGVPGVKSVRSISEFGFASVYVIFDDAVDFYWSRSRILEKLASMPPALLPEGVSPQLGPDATALGQIFWYTIEGRDADGRPAGGFEPQELRTVQDFTVRYALLGAEGVAEVASIGGFVKEYQIDLDPTLLQGYGVSVTEVADAVRRGNLDVGARVLEINSVEYAIRGLGFIRSLDDLRRTVVTTRDNVPVFVDDLGVVGIGPAQRRGALDKDGRDAVGGVVVVRYGENPLAVISRVKERIAEIAPSLPRKVLPDGRVVQATIVPFYDRTNLIHQTLHTLDEALTAEVLVTILVVMVMFGHLGSSILISALLPLSVLLTFTAMKGFGVDANIVALSGIAIAIGTMVDMGIILTENTVTRLAALRPGERRLCAVFAAAQEVGPAIVTAMATTVVSFLPVFFMLGTEGKLFKPLAFTKTFALTASLLTALAVIPPAAHLFFRRGEGRTARFLAGEGLIWLGGLVALLSQVWLGLALALFGLINRLKSRARPEWRARYETLGKWLVIAAVAVLLTRVWMPLGPQRSLLANLLLAAALIAPILGGLLFFQSRYARVLAWALERKRLVLALPVGMILFGGLVWLGFGGWFGWLPRFVRELPPVAFLEESFPGLSREFMPPLDEGAFLFMPTTMPHASIGEVQDMVRRQDEAIRAIPEVSLVVGKLGRVDSALDPAPVSMIETLIAYRDEYLHNDDGTLPRFRYDPDATDLARDPAGNPLPGRDGKPYTVRGAFARDERGALAPDPDGVPFRLWRPALDPELNPGRDYWPGVASPQDIWERISQAARMTGVTAAPKLMPIAARLVMLQSGIRASMGVVVKGPSIEAVQAAADQVERFLREVDLVEPLSVVADRINAKPYLEIVIDRLRAAQNGLDVARVQETIETAIGGKVLTTTVEGRERYPVRVRYLREDRDDIEALGKVLVTAPNGVDVPLIQVADIRYVTGPTMIKTEDGFVAGYVVFDGVPGASQNDVIARAGEYLSAMHGAGAFETAPGVSWSFTGTHKNQIRSEQRLALILPLTLALIFLILYLQFGSVAVAGMVFSGVAAAWAGGFLMLWLYGQFWFLNIDLLGVNLRDLFQMHPVNLSIAVWVGFLALFGVATDDGIIMGTYLSESFARNRPRTVQAIREAVIEAGLRRVRPCLMTTATTIVALVPVLTSRGRGADVLVPMAIPSFGGMCLVLVTMLIVPVLWCWREEKRLERPDEDEE